VAVVEEPDQYSTDFGKCLRYLHSNASRIIPASVSAEAERFDILVLGGLGGRVDQAFSQVHHFYSASQPFHSSPTCRQGELYLISEESITFLLREGRNTILTPGCFVLNSAKKLDHNGDGGSGPYLTENIGIIPVGGRAVISTHGLEWDVKDWETVFGGQISTSNHIRADMIEIDTSTPVLFTVELAGRLKFIGTGRL